MTTTTANITQASASGPASVCNGPTASSAGTRSTTEPATGPPGDDGLDEIRTDLAQRIKRCEDYALGWKIQAGTVLLEAKENLSPQDWGLLFRSGLPLCQRAAQILVRVVKNETLRHPRFLPHLPRSVDALHVLSHLDAATLEENIRAGTIHPGMTASAAGAFVRGRTVQTVPKPGEEIVR